MSAVVNESVLAKHFARVCEIRTKVGEVESTGTGLIHKRLKQSWVKHTAFTQSRPFCSSRLN